MITVNQKLALFPSPTGVNHYESVFIKNYSPQVLKANSFRPQQGLTIMNLDNILNKIKENQSFRPQQGLTIMNSEYKDPIKLTKLECFRPQQGLTIMNHINAVILNAIFF